MADASELGGGMSFSTHGSTPGSERTRGSAVDFASGLAAAFSSGRSREAAKTTTMANAIARIIAPTPTLRSGSPSNRCVRSRSRKAESLYLPRRRVSPASNNPTETRTPRKTAAVSPPSPADVPSALPLSRRPLFPMILIPSSCTLRSTGKTVLGDLQSVAIYTASYTARVLRSTSSGERLWDRK
jgi:hypothetical protein